MWLSSDAILFCATNFVYDHQNRVTSAFGHAFTYKTDGRLSKFENVNRSNNNNFPLHAYKSSSYLYDANGNMTKRGSQTLTWNHENRLSKVTTGVSDEEYLYDDSGQRIKKWNSSSAVYYPNMFYEVETGNGSVVASQLEAEEEAKAEGAVEISRPKEDALSAIFLPLVQADIQGAAEGEVSAASLATNVVKYYYFNGQRVAMKDGSTWYYLHGDHLGSARLETVTNSQVSRNQRYYAYGRKRSGSTGAMHSDLRYTGQQKDKTGLYYYNARVRSVRSKPSWYEG